MADREISYTLKITGAEQVDRALRGLAKTHEQTADQFLRNEAKKSAAVERENKKRVSQYQKMFREIEKEEQKQTKSQEQEAKKRQQIAEREAKEELNILAKGWAHRSQMEKKALADFKHASDQRKRMLEQEAAQARKNASTSLNVAGHLAGAAGQYQFGHLLRAGGGLVEGGFGAAIGPIGAAMAAIALTIGVTEMAFKSLVTQVEYVGSAFAGAIMQIGGAKNLQEMIVSTAKQESSIAHARLTVSGRERMSQGDLRSWSAGMSETAGFGGHEALEWDEAAKVLGAQTGRQKSILNDPNASRIIGQVSSIADVKPGVAAGLYSEIFNQNKSQSSSDVAARIRDIIGIGQAGQLSVSDIASEGGGVASLTNQLGGGFSNDLHAVFGAASLIKSKTRGNSLNEAGTQIAAFIRESNLHSDEAKDLGATFDDAGNINNFNEYLANVASKKRSDLPHWLQQRETAPFLGNIRSGVGLGEGDTGEGAKSVALEALNNQSKLTASEGEMADMAKEATTDLEKLKTAFNHLENALEPTLNKMLNQMTSKLEELSKNLDTFAPQIGKALEGLADAAMKSLPAILILLSVLARMGQAVSEGVKDTLFASGAAGLPGMDKVYKALASAASGSGGAADALWNVAGQVDKVVNAPPAPAAITQTATDANGVPVAQPLMKMEAATPAHSSSSGSSSHSNDLMVQAIKDAADELKRAAKMQQDAARQHKDNARGSTQPGEF